MYRRLSGSTMHSGMVPLDINNTFVEHEASSKFVASYLCVEPALQILEINF